MAETVMLPHWGMEMTEGTLVKWLKREGDRVEKGEPIAEIETEKAVGELESPFGGVLARVLVAEGSTVSVGAAVAVIAQPGEQVDLPPAAAAPAATARLQVGAAPAGKAAPAAPPAVQVEPAARRLAKERGIELARVKGTGPGGRIRLEDVQAAAAALAPEAPPAGQELTGLRAVIARRMQRSAQEAAAVTLTRETDVTKLEEMRPALRQQRIGRMAVVVKAVADSLKEHRAFNGYFRDQRLDLRQDVHIGFAVEVSAGLVVPVVRNADQKSLREISAEVRDLAAKAREQKISPQEVSGSTFTITSLAAEGVDAFTPIINPPELAILGVGRVVEKPAVREGVITRRVMLWLSLTFDHRTADGAAAARFLRAIAERLENPSWLTVG